MSRQPIHETIKLADKRQVERFDLTWEMIKYFTSKNISVQIAFDGLSFIVGDTHTTISNKIAVGLAVALEIILQCCTFSPGMFEKKNGRWHRAGESSDEY